MTRLIPLLSLSWASRYTHYALQALAEGEMESSLTGRHGKGVNSDNYSGLSDEARLQLTYYMDKAEFFTVSVSLLLLIDPNSIFFSPFNLSPSLLAEPIHSFPIFT